MQVAAVLWDYGGVFMASPFEAMSGVARKLGVEPEHYLGIVFGPYESDTDHPWHRLERGELSLNEAREQIIELGRAENIDSDPLHLVSAMGGGGISVREDVVELARKANASVQTALVTNNIAEFRDYWRKSIPLGELFDQVIDSSEIGLRKPDPKIFQMALEQLEVAPEATVFLDDYAGNVEAARKVGIHGIQVTENYGVALDELRGLLGSATSKA